MPQAAATREQEARRLLELVGEVARELHPGREVVPLLEHRLDADLGFDSLGRAELLLRLERAFQVGLPERLLGQAETPEDLLRAVLAAGPRAWPAPTSRQSDPEAMEGTARGETLPEILAWHSQRHPERVHLRLLEEDGEARLLTYGALARRAGEVAAGLVERGLEPGETVALMLPTGEDFFRAFLGILLAGGVPVPIYPPARLSQLEDHLLRQVGILDNAQAALLLTVSEALPLARLLQARLPRLRALSTVEAMARPGAEAPKLRLREGDLALIQYTSGSTGRPKGVALTHANLLANIRAIGLGARIRPTDVVVSWLPLYHDMGLIGCWLTALHHGCPCVILSPLAFLSRPERWLWALHRHRGTLSPAPNFAFELCARKVDPERLEGVDLSSWRMALNGAEPVSPDTLERFIARFEPFGFRREALAPVYGLAECAVALCFPPLDRGPRLDRVDRGILREEGRAEPSDDPLAQRIVACGSPLPGHEVRILDAFGMEAGERVEGRIQFKGPSATLGYHRNPAENARLFDGPWLETGDLGYWAEGDLFITGRAKDLIIRAGRNLHPQELEEVVGDLPGIRRGCVAAFGLPDPAGGTEKLAIMAETRRPQGEWEGLRRAVAAAVADLAGGAPDRVVLVPPHAIPKTSSGKLRRNACRALLEGGRRRSPGLQILRLGLGALRPATRRLGRGLGILSYGLWAWAWTALFLPPLALGVALLPGKDRPWAFLRRAGRPLLRILGLNPALDGLEDLPEGPCVLAANHASYLDGPLLALLIPRNLAIVAKRELEGSWPIRFLLGRLGTLFVERFDPKASAAETGRILEALREGHSVLVFPEGTFTRASGLRPFHMGAFLAAAQAGVPLVPLGLRGTRSLLREGQLLPRRVPLRIWAHPPLQPTGDDWSAALDLRDRTRAHLLKACGEGEVGG